jgi:hypothetical protein
VTSEIYYGLAKDFGQADYFETDEQIVRELKLEIKVGKLVALSGIMVLVQISKTVGARTRAP